MIDEEMLAQALESNEELEVLVVRAVDAAAKSASATKRQRLANVVKQAVLDEAKVDEFALVVGVPERIEVAHIRCLEAVHRAEERATASGALRPVARGAEKELTQEVREVAETYSGILLRQLEGLGLLDGSVTWDGTSTSPGPPRSAPNFSTIFDPSRSPPRKSSAAHLWLSLGTELRRLPPSP